MENFLVILFIAFALACDAFSVGLAVGTNNVSRGATLRLALSFGWFQFMMSLIGWFLGSGFQDSIGQYAGWIAAALLIVIAINMARDGLKNEVLEQNFDPTKGLSLLTLSIATSLDALGVGLGMGALGDAILYPAMVIGVVAFLMTYLGVLLGTKLSQKFGNRMKFVGAAVLLIIAVKLLPL